MTTRLSVTVVVSREDDRFVAQCLEVDVSSFGDTQAEALAMVTEALELWFEDTPVPATVKAKTCRRGWNCSGGAGTTSTWALKTTRKRGRLGPRYISALDLPRDSNRSTVKPGPTTSSTNSKARYRSSGRSAVDGMVSSPRAQARKDSSST